MTDLGALLADPPAAFALLYRAGHETVDVLVGTESTVDLLADLPLADDAASGVPRQELLALIPFRQITERGFDCRDDGAPILALSVREQSCAGLADVLRLIPDMPVELANAGFATDDPTYADIVRGVLADEIGRGAGANFVIRRDFTAELPDFSPAAALAVFARLLRGESGAHWVFLVRLGSRMFLGASPERHVSLESGVAVMNPISGTYRYPGGRPELDGVLEFLADRKEADELSMVVDEELKMMARVCPEGGRAHGPYLKEMARVAHTEYLIEGKCAADVRELLRETMFAPTVTGSPLENACRVIARHEPTGRGYYSGVAALIGRDATGERTLDSAILIRTADIDRGRLRIGLGATLVRGSRPESEAAETAAKAEGLLAAFRGGLAPRPAHAVAPVGARPEVRTALAERNTTLARFWLTNTATTPVLRGTRGVIVDAEDTFTAMLAHQLTALGAEVEVRPYRDPGDLDHAGFVVVGPGPGDPGDGQDPKIAALRRIVRHALIARTPMLAVCLGHQVLSSVLGLSVRRRTVPNQGTQREIDLFGRRESVGFYNSFTAVCPDPAFPTRDGPVAVSRDERTGQVHALRGPGFASVQFHPESVLTRDGPAILGDLLGTALGTTTRGRRRTT
ncbi:phenazine-specific anthranilate synthase component I [Actinokineospora enzanensis]|uniref:phenazine-specific anthranilate synthase component I n=1 Tax=Actinokineospora enzanensis TaxID=155975 RepID=UPI0003638DBC|nr:phenazine-specific anthranilate synthase component I [Actinokineospora enzanensis]